MTSALRRQILDLGDKLDRQDKRHRQDVKQLRADLAAAEDALADQQDATAQLAGALVAGAVVSEDDIAKTEPVVIGKLDPVEAEPIADPVADQPVEAAPVKEAKPT